MKSKLEMKKIEGLALNLKKLEWLALNVMGWTVDRQEVIFVEYHVNVRVSDVYVDSSSVMQSTVEQWDPYKSENVFQVMEMLSTTEGYTISNSKSVSIITIMKDGESSHYKHCNPIDFNATVCELLLLITGFYD